ncbi:MAG TPA: ATP-binding protein [Pyrinomonadaceae bacterium]|jgi:hypothetical protein
MAKFKTRARAIDMLGRQQIANISTAISELFKNSYDAYADSIEADYFRYNNLFVLRDDGYGMTETEFTDRWLAVGTESKHEEGNMDSISPPKEKEVRPMMGEKGIGRLAISTIGSQVLIISRAERKGNQFPTVAAFINWRIFESPGIDLDQIFIPVEPYPVGTLPSREEVLVLVDMFRDNLKNLKKYIPERLREEILADLEQFDFDPIQIDEYLTGLSLKESNKKNKLSLREDKTGTHFYILPTSNQLASEIDEEPESEGSAPLIKTLIGFTNSMKISSEETKSGNSEKLNSEKLEPSLSIRTAFRDHKKEDFYEDLINTQNFFTQEDFRHTDHLVEGSFDEDGNFHGTVKIYTQKAIKHTVSKPKGITGKTKCGVFRIKFGYVQGAKAESSLTEMEFNDINSKLGKIGGLYVYKDGIRIQPYGNYDVDYLGLEIRRTKGAGYYFFSYRRLFGYIEVSRKNNPELAEKAGREGFIENDAYKHFKRILVNLFLQLATDFFRDKGRNLGGFQETKTELEKTHKILQERQAATNKATIKLRKDLSDLIGKLDGKIPAEEVAKIIEGFSKSVSSLKENLYGNKKGRFVIMIE